MAKVDASTEKMVPRICPDWEVARAPERLSTWKGRASSESRLGGEGFVHPANLQVAKDTVSSTQLSQSSSYTATWNSSSGWSTPYNPSDMRSDTVLVVETLVYDIRQGKPVWAGRSQSTNTAKVDSLITELADQTAQQLRKQGLVK
jgi:hypothetical protein